MHEDNFFIRNKDYLIIITLLIIVLIAFFIFIFASSTKPPIIKFIDKDDKEVDGKVYLDGNLIGETENGEFKDLPKSSCKKSHSLKFETDEQEYEWTSYPINCNFNIITYSIEDKIVSR